MLQQQQHCRRYEFLLGGAAVPQRRCSHLERFGRRLVVDWWIWQKYNTHVTVKNRIYE
jgi:hypothetical protein